MIFKKKKSEIVDGNLKMILGMLWTLILRFEIQDISLEGLFVLYEEEKILEQIASTFLLILCYSAVCQGRPSAVVPAQDRGLQERQSWQLPHEVRIAWRW